MHKVCDAVTETLLVLNQIETYNWFSASVACLILQFLMSFTDCAVFFTSTFVPAKMCEF